MNDSADYKLDPDASIGIHFPTVIYDGQISPMVLRGGMQAGKEPFPPGSTVQVELEGDYYTGTVKSVHIGDALPNYHISFPESPETIEVTQTQLLAPGEPVFPMVQADYDETADDSMPTMPKWIKENTYVSIRLDGSHRRGTLVSTDTRWMFQQRTASGRVTYTLDLADLPVTWKDRLTEGTLELGWQQAKRAYHVSASKLKLGPPPSLQRSMKKDYPDRKIWVESYFEEANGLKEMDTYVTITAKEYAERYPAIQVISSMCIQTVKPDENGDPDHVKTRIVALGNHQEDRIWEKSEKFTPVLCGESSRVMTSMAIQAGRREKQGDCKNAFCQSYLPKGETIILATTPKRLSRQQGWRSMASQEDVIRLAEKPVPLVSVY
jgi:hypothetical protein